jgi:hypothetical protein
MMFGDDPRRDLPPPPPVLFWTEILLLMEEISISMNLLAEAAQEQAESLRQLAEKGREG